MFSPHKDRSPVLIRDGDRPGTGRRGAFGGLHSRVRAHRPPAEGKDAAWALASKVLGTPLFVLAAASVTGSCWPRGWSRCWCWVFCVPGQLALTSALLCIMFPYIFLVGLAALSMAISIRWATSWRRRCPPGAELVIIASAVLVAPPLNSRSPRSPSRRPSGARPARNPDPTAVARGWRPAVRVAPIYPVVREIGRLTFPARPDSPSPRSMSSSERSWRRGRRRGAWPP